MQPSRALVDRILACRADLRLAKRATRYYGLLGSEAGTTQRRVRVLPAEVRLERADKRATERIQARPNAAGCSDGCTCGALPSAASTFAPIPDAKDPELETVPLATLGGGVFLLSSRDAATQGATPPACARSRIDAVARVASMLANENVNSLLGHIGDETAEGKSFYTSSYGERSALRNDAAALWRALDTNGRAHMLSTHACYVVKLDSFRVRDPILVYSIFVALTCIFGLDDAALVAAWRTRLVQIDARQVAALLARAETFDALLDYRTLTIMWTNLDTMMRSGIAASNLWRLVFAHAVDVERAQENAAAAAAVDAATNDAAATNSGGADDDDGSNDGDASDGDGDDGISLCADALANADGRLSDAVLEFVDAMGDTHAATIRERESQCPINIYYVGLGWFFLRRSILDAVIETVIDVASACLIAVEPAQRQATAATATTTTPAPTPARIPSRTPPKPAEALPAAPTVPHAPTAPVQSAPATVAQTFRSRHGGGAAPPTTESTRRDALASILSIFDEQLERASHARPCAVCMLRDCDAVVLPCRHLALCAACPRPEKCPVCDAPATDTLVLAPIHDSAIVAASD